MGIRSTGRLLKIGTSTVINRIKKIAKDLAPDPNYKQHGTYEVDELRTFVKKNQRNLDLLSLLQRNAKNSCYQFWKKNFKKIKLVIDYVLSRSPKKIYTDKLIHYKSLIKKKMHNIQKRCTNHIEPFHLNLRTHLKRLNRKTICFSKRILMLERCVKIYIRG